MREAGLGRTIFYRHFDDLGDLLMRASREAVIELFDAQRRFVEARPGDADRRRAPVARGGRRGLPAPRAAAARVAEAAAGDEQIAADYAAMRERFDDLRRAGAARHRRPRPGGAGRPGGDRARAEPDERDLPDRRVRPRAARVAARPPCRPSPRSGTRSSTADERTDRWTSSARPTSASRPAGLPLRAPLRRGRRPAPAPPRRGQRLDGALLPRRAELELPLPAHARPARRPAGTASSAPTSSGFGRSDKPTDQGWYTYDRHVETVTRHLDQLDLERRDRRRAGLGRPDRAALGGRARRPGRRGS